MRLDPYLSFAGYAFSLRRDDVLKQRGTPLHAQRNDIGLNELDYGDVVLRFQDGGRLEEITVATPVLHLGTVAIPFENLESFVTGQDAQAFWRFRFLVSPALGLAFDPSQPAWVTALARHCLPQWEAL
jgi:hypothetical protein